MDTRPPVYSRVEPGDAAVRGYACRSGIGHDQKEANLCQVVIEAKELDR